jgi:predicted nucleic acid-binding protein
MDKGMGPVSGCVIDTNILIYHLAGVLTDQAEANLVAARESGSYISIITRIELIENKPRKYITSVAGL